MKKAFTLAAASLMAAGALSAQAQVIMDGQLTAPEITAGNYVLIGRYTNPRGFGDAGLLSLYAASTPTKVFFFVGGTVETNGNAFQLFMDLPATAGVPAGTALPAGAAGTSFEKMTARLDMNPDLALALRSDGAAFQIEAAAYAGATGSSRKLTTTAGTLPGTGASLMLPTATGAGYALLQDARVSYRNSPMGMISTNPGNTMTMTGTPPAPTFPASYGGVGSFGWEIELDRARMNLGTGTPSITLFLIQNNNDGGFLSSDYIPQATTPLAGNGNVGDAASANFATIAGRQAATITLGANGVLGNKAADAASVAMSVYPNPANGETAVAYNVAGASEQVSITLTDLLGRQVQVLASGLQSAGTKVQKVNTADVAAGTYLVRVQVGDKVSTRKVVLL